MKPLELSREGSIVEYHTKEAIASCKARLGCLKRENYQLGLLPGKTSIQLFAYTPRHSSVIASGGAIALTGLISRRPGSMQLPI